MLELEDYCNLQALLWKTSVTIITVMDSYVRTGSLLSFTKTLLEDHFIANFRDSYVRIGRLLSFTRTLLEEHCHCHHCHC